MNAVRQSSSVKVFGGGLPIQKARLLGERGETVIQLFSYNETATPLASRESNASCSDCHNCCDDGGGSVADNDIAFTAWKEHLERMFSDAGFLLLNVYPPVHHVFLQAHLQKKTYFSRLVYSSAFSRGEIGSARATRIVYGRTTAPRPHSRHKNVCLATAFDSGDSFSNH